MNRTGDLHTPGLRRIQKELADMKEANLSSLRELVVEEGNIFIWHGLICPEFPPYNNGAFKVDIIFPLEYPFKPPKILLKTKIYHPNFDEKGEVCLGMLTPEHWKPSTSVEQVLQVYVALLNNPDPSDVLRVDIGRELAIDRERFMRNAEAYTEKYAERRPVDYIPKTPDDQSEKDFEEDQEN